MRRLLILAFLGPLTIQTPVRSQSMAGPSLGLSFNERTGELRRVVGLPGAALFGPTLDGVTALVRAEVAPRGGSALGVSADGTVLRFQIGGEQERLEVPPRPDLIVFSPDGETAALLYLASGRIEVLRFENGRTAARTIEINVVGPVSLAAVADDGAVLVATSAGTVHLFNGQDAPRQVGTVRHAAAAAFLPRSHDALIADDGGDEVFLLRGDGFVPLASPLEGVAGPSCVAAYDDGTRALIVNGRAATVLTVALDGGAREVTDCACRPRSLRETSVPGVYWLAENILFDARGDKRLWFVPQATGDRGDKRHWSVPRDEGESR